MSRKTLRNLNHHAPMELLVRKDMQRIDRLKRGASEEGQKWINRKGERAFKKEQRKQDRVTRNVTETRAQESPNKENTNGSI